MDRQEEEIKGSICVDDAVGQEVCLIILYTYFAYIRALNTGESIAIDSLMKTSYR